MRFRSTAAYVCGWAFMVFAALNLLDLGLHGRDAVSVAATAALLFGCGVAYVIGIREAGILKFLIVAGWFAVPVLAQMIEHPTHAAGFFFYWLHGLAVPRYFMAAEVTRAELTAVLALAGVIFA